MAMGAPAEGTPGTEMTSISFRDQLWLSAYPLDRNLVFDYFALSPFYDRTCNNEQLRMESIHPLDMNHLSKKTGMEYILQDAQEPHLFVIRKQKREGPEKVSAQAAYYVLDGSIYQAPHLYNVIGSRVVRSLYHITNAFAQASTKLEKIGAETENGKPVSEVDADVQLKKSTAKVVDVKEVLRVDSILAGIMRKLPPAPPPPAPLVPVSNTVPGTEITQAPTASDVKQEQASAGGKPEQGSAKRLKVER